MPSPNPNRGSNNIDPEMIAAALGDPELKAEINELVRAATQHARWLWDWGTDADRTTVVKSIVPQMMKGIESERESERQRLQRAHYDSMRKYVQWLADRHGRPEDDA